MLIQAKVTNGEELVGALPCAQYQINDDTLVCVVGTEQEPDGDPDGEGVVDWKYLGHLEEQNLIFQIQIKNSLLRDNWNFEAYPNPLVILGKTL